MHPEHILVIAEGQLGDLLLLTPALRALQESFPSAKVSVLVLDRRPASAPADGSSLPRLLSRDANHVLATNPSISQLFLLQRDAIRGLRGLHRLRAEAAMIRWLRRLAPDAVIVTFPEDRFVAWALLSGARARIGQADQPLRRLLTHPVPVHKAQAGVLVYYCELVKALGAGARDARTVFHLPQRALQDAARLLDQSGVARDTTFIVVHPGASGDYKIWPPALFAELIDRLSLEGRQVVIVKGVQDERVVEELVTAIRRPVPVIDTGSNVGTLAAIMQRAALCITNDSGPRHLAVAVGVASVSFFRQHHDREWKVYEETARCRTLQGTGSCPACPPGSCKDLIPPGEHFGAWCVRMIAVEDALTAVRQALER